MGLYALDLIGTFAFSVYGSYVGIKKNFDIIGVFFCGFLTGVGGGTIREIMLGNIPFYFLDTNYIYAIMVGTFFSIITYRVFEKINKCMLIIDAVGLATFAYIGAFKASQAGLGMFAMMFFAGLTAAGGSVMRDVLVRELPSTLYTDLYITPAALTALAYGLLPLSYRGLPIMPYLFLLAVFIPRLYAIFHKVQIWKPQRSAMQLRLWRYVGPQKSFSWEDRSRAPSTFPAVSEKEVVGVK